MNSVLYTLTDVSVGRCNTSHTFVVGTILVAETDQSKSTITCFVDLVTSGAFRQVKGR